MQGKRCFVSDHTCLETIIIVQLWYNSTSLLYSGEVGGPGSDGYSWFVWQSQLQPAPAVNETVSTFTRSLTDGLNTARVRVCAFLPICDAILLVPFENGEAMRVSPHQSPCKACWLANHHFPCFDMADNQFQCTTCCSQWYFFELLAMPQTPAVSAWLASRVVAGQLPRSQCQLYRC